ncbi:hypothetical protein GCM10010377_53860 [Streptomyces viridiviolaceus]|uniref:Uncharacterized protein n=1 Tax=Streptomyces viridiviolaceus TaxID=68282 RepID=A0ABW2E0J7_9ACTN|nr:hypothetical protein [Streptomyces viridiviolaceus]GHB55960.1 hypothetical protein GCM10010377_53860 [Streptomyces viridiviolaceus]
MAHSFLLKLTSSGGSPYLYRALVDGTREAFLLLDEESASIHLADALGNPLGGLRMTLPEGNIEVREHEADSDFQLEAEDFKLIAAHLGAQWRRKGEAPTEVRKFFA